MRDTRVNRLPLIRAGLVRVTVAGLCLMTALALGAPAHAGGRISAQQDPYSKDIKDASNALKKSLNKSEKESLSLIMAGFGAINAVSLTRNQVEAAVDTCRKKNPDLADTLRKRFNGWKKEIDPLLDTNRKLMDGALSSSLFRDSDKIRDYITLIDKRAQYADAQIPKEYVTGPEECQGLIDAMGRTEETLVKVLKDVAWPVAPEHTP